MWGSTIHDIRKRVADAPFLVLQIKSSSFRLLYGLKQNPGKLDCDESDRVE
jgi:hypothetical protein